MRPVNVLLISRNATSHDCSAWSAPAGWELP